MRYGEKFICAFPVVNNYIKRTMPLTYQDILANMDACHLYSIMILADEAIEGMLKHLYRPINANELSRIGMALFGQFVPAEKTRIP